MTDSDLSTFKKLFKQYFNAIATRRNSLLARIYGIYTVKMEEVAPVHLILMGNTKKSIDKNIVNVFDLKGSFVNREVIGNDLKPTSTLKDINMLNLCKQMNMLRFRPEDQKDIMENLERDVNMLRSKNIMDYSLLLAVEKNMEYRELQSGTPGGGTIVTQSKTIVSGLGEDFDELVEAEMRSRINCPPHKYLSRGGRYIYHLAIIDYLQDFNLDKKLENMLKTVLNKPDAQISAVEPHAYANRYLKFMKEKVIIDQKQGGNVTSAGGATPTPPGVGTTPL